MTEAQKIAWYRATLAAGFTNEAIRAAVEARYGRQSDSDWTYLRAKAAQTAAQTAAPAGGGAGLLIAAAAAAYFLLG
jgi:predicted kinase